MGLCLGWNFGYAFGNLIRPEVDVQIFFILLDLFDLHVKLFNLLRYDLVVSRLSSDLRFGFFDWRGFLCVFSGSFRSFLSVGVCVFIG